MTKLATPRATQPTRYRHETFGWRGIDEYLSRTVPFVREGLKFAMPTLVGVTRERWNRLSRALGPDAKRVRFLDLDELGGNPARIVPAWLEFVAEHAADGVAMRGIAEPVWAGPPPAKITECQIHEALLRRGEPADVPLWLLCPYDADGPAPGLADHAPRVHPDQRVDVDRELGRFAHRGREHTHRLMSRPLPEPSVTPETLSFGRGDLARVRRLVARRAAAAGLERCRVDDLVLGVNEVAANSLDHGGGSGVVRAWSEPGALVFEVHDAGRIDDPLVGRVHPSPSQTRGRGLWMVNILCDLLQIRSTDEGTTMRVLTWLRPSDEVR